MSDQFKKTVVKAFVYKTPVLLIVNSNFTVKTAKVTIDAKIMSEITPNKIFIKVILTKNNNKRNVVSAISKSGITVIKLALTL